MNWTRPKGNKKKGEPVVTIDPRFMRCECCAVGDLGFGQPRVGTLLVTESVQLIPDQVRDESGRLTRAAYIEIGKVIRCPNEASKRMRFDAKAKEKVRICSRPPTFQPGEMFDGTGIKLSSVYALLRVFTGIPSFYADELRDGRARTYPLPDSLAEITRPRFNVMPKVKPQEALF